MRYNPTDMLRDIGAKIKDAREEQGLSQKDLGMSLGLSDKAVSAYEASRTIPPLETLIRIAEELNKPLDYFIKDNSPDYRVETRIATMEQKVAQLLKEITLIREDLNLSPTEPSESEPSESETSETGSSESDKNPLDMATNEEPNTEKVENIEEKTSPVPESPPNSPPESPSEE